MRHKTSKTSKILRLSHGLETNEQQVPRIKEAVTFLDRVLEFLVVRAGQDNCIYFFIFVFLLYVFRVEKKMLVTVKSMTV